jgi:hypothetical protein
MWRVCWLYSMLIGQFNNLSGMVFFFHQFKNIVQRILRGVNTKLKKSVLVNWRPGHFEF